MRKRYTDNTKKPKPKENQLGILKIYAFCQKIQQKTSGSGERCWCYISMRMHQKNCRIFPLKVFTTLLSGSRKGTSGVQQSHSYGRCQGFMLTLQALAYIEGNDQTTSPIWNYVTGTLPDILERVLKSIMLSRSTAGKCTPMQVIKQPEHGRTSTTKEQK